MDFSRQHYTKKTKNFMKILGKILETEVSPLSRTDATKKTHVALCVSFIIIEQINNPRGCSYFAVRPTVAPSDSSYHTHRPAVLDTFLKILFKTKRKRLAGNEWAEFGYRREFLRELNSRILPYHRTDVPRFRFHFGNFYFLTFLQYLLSL